jgi:hypothetical protein
MFINNPGSRNLFALQPVDSKGWKIVLLAVAAWKSGKVTGNLCGAPVVSVCGGGDQPR